MHHLLFSRFDPSLSVVYLSSAEDKEYFVRELGLDFLEGIDVPKKGVDAQVCKGRTCQLPVHTAKDFQKLLEE